MAAEAVLLTINRFDEARGHIENLRGDRPSRAEWKKILAKIVAVQEIASQSDTPAIVKTTFDRKLDELLRLVRARGYVGMEASLASHLNLPPAEKEAATEARDNEILTATKHLQQLNGEIKEALSRGDTEEANGKKQQFELELGLPLPMETLSDEEKHALNEHLNRIRAQYAAILQSTALEESRTAEEEPSAATPRERAARKNRSTTRAQQAIIDRASGVGIEVYPAMAAKWEKYTGSRKDPGGLLNLAEKTRGEKNPNRVLSPAEATRMVKELTSVKDWRAKDINLKPLIQIFTTLLEKEGARENGKGVEPYSLMTSTIDDLKAMNETMRQAYDRALHEVPEEKLNPKRQPRRSNLRVHV